MPTTSGQQTYYKIRLFFRVLCMSQKNKHTDEDKVFLTQPVSEARWVIFNMLWPQLDMHNDEKCLCFQGVASERIKSVVKTCPQKSWEQHLWAICLSSHKLFVQIMLHKQSFINSEEQTGTYSLRENVENGAMMVKRCEIRAVLIFRISFI